MSRCVLFETGKVKFPGSVPRFLKMAAAAVARRMHNRYAVVIKVK